MKLSFSDIGIVIRSVDSGEADKYVSIISQEHGLVDLIARGARRLTSKKAPHLDQLNLVKFQVDRGDSPKFLNQVETISFYPQIKNNFSKTGICLTITEILNSTLPKEVEDKEIYLSLKTFLESVEKAEDKKEINRLGRKFGLYLLRHLGFPLPKHPETDNLSTYFESIMNKKLISPQLK